MKDLAVALVVVLDALLLLFLRLVPYTKTTKEGQQLGMRDQLRKERNQKAEAEKAEDQMELGWPQTVEQMKPEEVAHQLCIQLAEKLWNRPNVD